MPPEKNDNLEISQQKNSNTQNDTTTKNNEKQSSQKKKKSRPNVKIDDNKEGLSLTH